ncbi:DUF3102 domain-containing protein [Symmachiella dynata]|uniref:DUF3102 domain-containing protein n=1 Tax=Symmachiella dynata TaxID=2527995 RepID=UPI0030ED590D
MNTITELSTTNLAAICKEIANAHRECESALKAGLDKANRVGELLLEAKQAVPHGGWSAWVEENCEFSLRTAQTYMRINREFPTLSKAQRVAHLPLREAADLLAEPKPVDIPLPEIGQHLYGDDGKSVLEIIPQGDGSAFHLNLLANLKAGHSGHCQNKAIRRDAVEMVIRLGFSEFDLNNAEWIQLDGPPNESVYHPYCLPTRSEPCATPPSQN